VSVAAIGSSHSGIFGPFITDDTRANIIADRPPMRQELRQPVRLFQAHPAFTAVAVRMIALGIGAGMVLGAAASAQSPARTPAPFEVVSVKRSAPEARMTRPGSPDPGGRWQSLNATLLMIIGRAYPDYATPGLIVGGPGWIHEARFDIDARAGREVPRAEYPAMVQQILADRFKLKVHTEARTIDVYALVVARSDGRLGPRLKPASAECLAELEAERQRRAADPGPITIATGQTMPCGGTVGGLVNGITRLNGARTIDSLAFGIQAFMDTRVIDRTGLNGMYELDLEFDYMAMRSVADARPEFSGLNIFTALQEQLGLKLEPRKEMVDVLVIDAVEMPSEN